MSEDENHDRAKWGRLFHSIRCAHSVPQTSPFQEPDSTLNNPIQRLDNPDHLISPLGHLAGTLLSDSPKQFRSGKNSLDASCLHTASG